MVNLSAFSKINKIQKLLNAHHSLLACSSTYASTVLLRSKRLKFPQNQQDVDLSSHSHTRQWQDYFSHRCSSSSKNSSSDSPPAAPTTSSAAPSSTIDEFRAREEKREEDFARQQEQSKNDDTKSSAEEEAKRAKVEAIRLKILEAALLHVPTLGWTRKAIIQGAEDAGLPSVVHGMFPEGGFALVSYFNGKCNDELINKLKDETQNGEKEVSDPLNFLVSAVRRRLEMIAPFKGQWPQAMALIALPQNASTSLAQVLTLVDDICYYSGDRSVDLSWYTRRVGLATIMKMTELYMLQDSSSHHEKTWEFLKNRMDEAVQLQMMLSQTEGVTSSFQRSFNSAFVTARNILGINYNRR